MSLDPISTRFESILERALTHGKDLSQVLPLIETGVSSEGRARPLTALPAQLTVSGCTSELALALLLSQMTSPVFTQVSHLVVLAHPQEVPSFVKNLKFFDPELQPVVLSRFDVSPYSGLYPNHRLISARIQFLYRAQMAKPGQIFVADIESLLQKTLPRTALSQRVHTLRKGQNIGGDLVQKLTDWGYQSTPVVEDPGQFAWRGGIVDIFTPAHDLPTRLELFGDEIESIRTFDPETQRSQGELNELTILPPREILFTDQSRERAARLFRQNLAGRDVDQSEWEPVLHSLVHGQMFPGIDFLLPYFYENLDLPLAHFHGNPHLWYLDQIEIDRAADLLTARLQQEHAGASHQAVYPQPDELYARRDQFHQPEDARRINFSRVQILEDGGESLEYTVRDLVSRQRDPDDLTEKSINNIKLFKADQYCIFISAHTQAQAQRLFSVLEKSGYRPLILSEDLAQWQEWLEEQRAHPKVIHILPRGSTESVRIAEEQLVFLREEDFFGRKIHRERYKSSGSLESRAGLQSFGDLEIGDFVVHVLHGVGIYDGLKVMSIQGVDAEFVQLRYKDDDRLYLPIYRINQIQKYAAAGAARILDKLGGTSWEKATIKVKSKLRDIASDLLMLYAQRTQITRPPFSPPDSEYEKFETFFPYDETEDQLRCVSDVINDMKNEKPMDRLVCGDVGFGKTEIAMRAAFLAVESERQVALLAPTTVLTFQHLETFQKRFQNWPVNIRSLNRFVGKADVKKTLEDLKAGKVDIVIGTHRLLSHDVEFANLGLLIVDEEQRFGVSHKEKIRKVKTSVDTLALSATPIPRTLNMSLSGLRDLSIINTPPMDRLPTRTFVCKFDEATIQKAVNAEMSRGGQIFFIHNRIQSIHGLADQLRTFLPNIRMKIAHGQMPEGELEKAMIAFFHHEIDMLICTTIVESGMDIPRANTMFIDEAHTFGLSQLYQLRGRVGRSKERAYCYLILPQGRAIDSLAQERLKVIQENTALGSGIRIAQHDLELRGAGNLLGEDQSGQINAVGYELYMELLEEALKEAKGQEIQHEIEPEMNVRIPALIPSDYIPDIRIRLSYYKALSQIENAADIDRIEEALRDQYGKPPEPVMNLMGMMLIRRMCKELGVRDLSSGAKSISLAFTPQTPLEPQKVVQLTLQSNKKYSLTPDSRLIVRMNSITWPHIFEELESLKKLTPKS